MTPERWQRIGTLFDRALAVPEADRRALVQASGESSDVQHEVLSLLGAHQAAPDFLEPADLLEPGATCGPYRIVRLIGRGGMGVVYLAEDQRLRRQVALKALPPHLVADDRSRERLRQEARAAAALSHPAIAGVFACEEIDGHVFIASEYVDGPTLREVLAAGPLPPDQWRAVAGQVAQGLVAAHGRGIVHRDLKPENIVRAASGAVKILDFGLAQIDETSGDLASVSRLTEPGLLQGTPLYMAPEQLLGEPTDARTDQFAFGVLLYELITGRHPFGRGPLPTVIARVLDGAIEPAPDVPRDVWPVVQTCLARNPADRFASTLEMAGALTPVGTPGTVRTPGTMSGSLWWWTMHQLVVALAYWAMVWPAWHVHRWTGRAGVLTFLATLASVVVAGNLRLHLWFTARTFPTELAAQRAYVGRWVRAGDAAFALLTTATGLVIADAHTGWGALFVAMGLGAALALLAIEPATARSAFGSPPSAEG